MKERRAYLIIHECGRMPTKRMAKNGGLEMSLRFLALMKLNGGKGTQTMRANTPLL